MPRVNKKTRTVGWQPGCACDAGDPIPCTVLDPFFGSGTTAVVAETLGRTWIGVELNPEYAELAEKRITAARRGGTLRPMVQAQKQERAGQLPLVD